MASRSPWDNRLPPEKSPYEATPGVPEGSIGVIEGSRPWGNVWVGPAEDEPRGVCFVADDLDPTRPCPLSNNAIARGSDLFCPCCFASGHDKRIDDHYEREKARIRYELRREQERREEDAGTFAQRRFGKQSA